MESPRATLNFGAKGSKKFRKVSAGPGEIGFRNFHTIRGTFRAIEMAKGIITVSDVPIRAKDKLALIGYEGLCEMSAKDFPIHLAVIPAIDISIFTGKTCDRFFIFIF